jgi:uncharacterized protein YbaA (DUF1428 family)
MAPIKVADIAEYKKTFEETSAIFKSLGALELSEFYSDDAAPKHKSTFPQAFKCAPDEVVVFGWSVWPSKDVLDSCNEELQRNPRNIRSTAHFDATRLIAGNFVGRTQ